MKDIFLLLFISFISHNLPAQDYLGIRPNSQSYFEYSTNTPSGKKIRAVVSDSVVTTSTGLEVYNFRQIQADSFLCTPVIYHNWSGIRTFQDTSGTETYFTKDGSAVTVVNNAITGQTWSMYSFVNGDYIEAQLLSNLPDNFLSLSDSVKTLQLQAKNFNGVSISHPMNGRLLKLSKNYGWVEVVAFKNFPSDTTSYRLVGITNPVTGFQLFSCDSIFNYNVGDTFQYHEFSQYSFSDLMEKYTEKVVIGKNYYPLGDSVAYTYSLKEHRYQQFSGNIQTTYLTDTVTETIWFKSYSFLEEVPEKVAIINGNYGWSEIASDTMYNSRWKISNYGSCMLTDYDTCNNSLTDCYLYDVYAEGLGNVYWEQTYWFTSFFELVYYHQGNQTWGTPLNWPAILNVPVLFDSRSKLRLLNNLVTDKINFFSDSETDKGLVMIYDVTGKTVLKQHMKIKKGLNSFPFRFFAGGSYFLNVHTSNESQNFKIFK